MGKDNKMKKINWSGYEWIPNERWGNFHPNKPKWWYDPSAIEITDEWINLKTHLNPSTEHPSAIIGAGLISCTERFKWGTFEIEAKLPVGEHLWPAFWMWSWQGWPPEIDVFEGYSNNRGSYFKFRWNRPFAFWNIQTNLHKKDKSVIGAKTHCFGFKNPTENFIKYKVDWHPEYVKWYYNDRLVRTIRNQEILDELNVCTMNVIINNGVRTNLSQGAPESNFLIKYFEYVPF